jgi:hypothetical protein
LAIDALAPAKLGPGRTSAAESVMTLRRRYRWSAKAGIDEFGIHETLATLEKLDANEPLLWFHWSVHGEVFSLLVVQRTRSLAGCVSVVRTNRG